MITERFAPSPTGELHLGHAFSAWLGWSAARAAGGRFLLRIEDLDTGRSRPDFVAGIFRDLAWFGIDWDGEPLFQSTRLGAYAAALDRLAGRDLTYRCTCSRRDIAEAASAPQEDAAPRHGPDGLVYPGTCRDGLPAEGAPAAIRLDIAAAIEALGGDAAVAALGVEEAGAGPGGERGEIALDPAALREGTGDIVLSRRDGAPAYHLAVVVDDAYQGVSHVTRGEDLFAAAPVQRLLQALLGMPPVVYRHHRLIRDAEGRRLAKRDRALSLAALRQAGADPVALRASLGLGDPPPPSSRASALP